MLFFLVGFLLIVYGTLYPLLSVIGVSATGEITVIRRELGERNEPLRNRFSYSIGYEFKTADGEAIYGNTKRIGNAYSAGISKGPAKVYYIEALPFVNALEADAVFSLGKAIILAAGILICIVSFIRKKGAQKD